MLKRLPLTGHRILRMQGLLLMVLLVTACTGLAPVYSVGEGPSGTYLVSKGDTLYSVAFRYGLDHKTLARMNGIRPPYTIYVDQFIKLRGSANRKESGTVVKKSPPSTVQTPTAPVSNWRWPLNGEVIGGFSLTNPVNKGIDIAGKRGQIVVAAADGVVVYAGGNLRGYGKLVIIKHNDNFLSAYGNNETMLVKEGDKVKAGKSITRVGSSAASTEMLHFEIRRDGKPENPARYLPRR